MSINNETKLFLFSPDEQNSLQCDPLRNNTHAMIGNTIQQGDYRSMMEKHIARYNTNPTTNQIQDVWNRVSYQDVIASEELQLSRLHLPSSQNPGPQEECKQMAGLRNDQIPAVNLPHGSDTFIDVDDIQDVYGLEDPVTPNPSCPSVAYHSDSRSTSSSEPVARHNHGVSELTAKVEAFEEEYFTTRMAYLIEEHQLKVKVLEEELEYWRRMNCNAAQNPECQPPLLQTSEQQTYHLISGAYQDLWRQC